MLDHRTLDIHSERIEALRRSGLLSRSQKDEFGHLTDHVRDVLDVPVAVVTLVDEERQVFAGHSGLPSPWNERGETPMTHSFCQHVVDQQATLNIVDANLDPLVKDNHAIGDIGVVAYLGVPLALPEGQIVGALAAIDTQPRVWTAADERRLRSIARTVEKEMAVRISESRWRSLFENLHEAFFVARIVRDENREPVDWVFEQVNDAWYDLTGFERGTVGGRSLRDVIPGIEDEWVEEFSTVVETGNSLRFTRRVGTLDRWYDGLAQAIGGDRFTVICIDVTERIARERRREALRDLAAALLVVDEPDTMSMTAAVTIGRALGVKRAGYGRLDRDGETFVVPADWTADGYPSLAGRYRLDDYGGYAEDLRQGQTVVISDIRLDSRTSADTAPLERMGVRTLINHPIVEAGRTVAILYVNDDEPRKWSSDELSFIKDAAGQARVAIERRRAEVALRESDERYRTFVENLDVGICTLEVLFDETGRPVDYLYLDANPAMSKQAGVDDVVGKRVLEFIPDIEPYWPELYGRVAVTGEPEHVQYEAKGLDRWFDIRALKIGEPEDRKVAVLFSDVTERVASDHRMTVMNEELAHRMKNSLAMVQAIATQTLRQSRTMEEGREAISARLSALARAQDILTRTNFAEADISEVVSNALSPHQDAARRVSVHGPHLTLDSQRALGLSLAIHELATNAAKYGALSNAMGRVEIVWGVVNGDFSFSWIESSGPPVALPERRGFGSKLIERIVSAYFDGQGHIDFDPAGIHFKLTGALAHRVRAA